jgi:putative DNA primase/helicase
MTGTTIERARWRWREILPQLGIETRFLVNRHGPCPLCGGRDRYRFDDRDGCGSYFCNQCGPGDGLILIRKRNGWDFKTAVDEIDKIIGTEISPRPAQKPRSAEADGNRCKDAIHRLLAESTDDRLVAAYLKSRGIDTPHPLLRGHSRCPYFDDDTRRLIGRFPAVIATIAAPNGSLQAAQRIYLDGPDPRKKAIGPSPDFS